MTSTTDTNELLRIDERGRVRVSAERRAELLAEFDRCGMSGAAFARWAGVKYTTLANWLQQRRKSAEAAPSSSHGKSNAATPNAPLAAARVEVAPVAWAEVVVGAPAAVAKASESTLCLRLPGGASLPLDGSRASLRQAAALLRELERNAGGAKC